MVGRKDNSKMQKDAPEQPNVVLKSTAGVDIVIWLCCIEIPHFCS